MNMHVYYLYINTARHLYVKCPQILLFSKTVYLCNFATGDLAVTAITCSAGPLTLKELLWRQPHDWGELQNAGFQDQKKSLCPDLHKRPYTFQKFRSEPTTFGRACHLDGRTSCYSVLV